MYKRIVFILLILLGVFSFDAMSQKRFAGFSGDMDTYIQELTEFYKSDVNMKKDVQKEYEALVQSYADIWMSLPIQQKKDIILLSNQMIAKRVRPIPGFQDFLETQVGFAKYGFSPENFNQWFKGMQWILQNSTIGSFNSAMSSSNNLVNKNTLYLSRTINWTYKNGDYNIRIDTSRGVYAEFTNVDLIYSSQKDFNTIHNTRGRFYIADDLFEGSGGKIDWTRAKFSQDEVFAELSDYTVSLRRAAISADSVWFTNKEYFQHRLRGRIEDQCSDKVGDVVFPRFTSYKREEIIRNVFPDVDYVGGFTQQGGKFLGTGDVVEPAELVFRKNKKVFCRAKAIVHPFSQEGITTPDCQITFYIGEDSIYHPGILMKYNRGKREFACIDNKEGISASPWLDSYHAIDIYTEAVYTGLDQDEFIFGSIKGPSGASFASFESNNYYTLSKWQELQKLDDVNPLYRVKAYSDRFERMDVPVKSFAKFIRVSEVQAEVLLMNLAINGFISYEAYRKTAIIKPKLFDYIMANNKRKDYDNLKLNSSVEGGVNAIFDISTMELRLSGIQRFSLSEKHFVNVRPTDGELVMKKNRSFSFDGQLMAGRINLAGSNCNFDYENFKLSLPNIDSLSFYVPLYEDTSKLVSIQTPIYNLDVELLIDAPNNKSSNHDLPNYPILSSLKDSYVYYDNPKTQGGVYDRERFYYKVKPFKFISLMSFKTDSVEFEGSLVSAGIFPEINEPLKVMRDYSLGFITESPKEGYPIYDNKGRFHNRIDLSMQGLLGAGSLDYLASTSTSKLFVFMPDSTNAITEEFKVKSSNIASGEYADAIAGETSMRWYPNQDYMLSEKINQDFSMYSAEAIHNGTLRISPYGLGGNGVNKSEELIVESNDFNFKQDYYLADTSNITLNTIDGQNIAFRAQELRSSVNFSSRKAEFTSLSGPKSCELEYIQYNCMADKFSWNFDSKEFAFLNSESMKSGGMGERPLRDIIDVEQPGVMLVSTNPIQKQLSFHSVEPMLDLNTNQLTANEVFCIKSADAAIRPMNHQVIIHPGAQMDTIERAEILVDTEDKIHLIHDSRAAVFSSEFYTANGYIDYMDENNKKHEIFLNKVFAENQKTKAMGRIDIDHPLALSPNFNYYGEIRVEPKDSNYYYNGYVGLTHKCVYEPAWMKFVSKLDPNNIMIPVVEAPVSDQGDRMTASVLYSIRDLKARTAFITKGSEVNSFITLSGYLGFDKASNSYVVASQEKHENMKESNKPFLSFNKSTCEVRGKGDINLGLGEKGLVETESYGEIISNNEDEVTKFSMSFGLRFPFSDKALEYMGVELYEDLNLGVIDLESSRYNEILVNKFGDKGEDLYEDLLITGEWRNIPKGMDYTLYFTNVNFEWDPMLNSYLSYGDLEIAIVGKYQCNRIIKGRIEIVKTTISHEFRIHLEQDFSTWYFFTYNGSSMSAISSNDIFNDIIKDTPNKDREFKTKEGRMYTYRLATPNERRNFIRKVQKIYDDNE